MPPPWWSPQFQTRTAEPDELHREEALLRTRRTKQDSRKVDFLPKELGRTSPPKGETNSAHLPNGACANPDVILRFHLGAQPRPPRNTVRGLRTSFSVMVVTIFTSSLVAAVAEVGCFPLIKAKFHRASLTEAHGADSRRRFVATELRGSFHVAVLPSFPGPLPSPPQV